MKGTGVILVIVSLAATRLFADEPASSEQGEGVARIFDRKITRKEIEPSDELRKRDAKLFPNQKWSDLVIQYRNDNLASLIGKPLMEQFVKEQNIQVTEKELDKFADAMMAEQPEIDTIHKKLIKDKEAALKQEGLTQEKREKLKREIRALREDLATSKEQCRKDYRGVGKSTVEMWKINQALYRIYGGRVIWQQAGIEPLDAYRQFLEKHEKRGDFEIFDSDLRKRFWAYYVTMRHTEVPKDKVDFRTPWWLKAKERESTDE